METLWGARYAHRTHLIQSSIIREILKFASDPDVISFAGGLPAPEIFPVDGFKKAFDTVLSEHGPEALQYSITEGYIPLREQIRRHTARYSIDVSIDNILLTSGSQQALDLLGKIFINEGDRVLVEAPTYLGAIQAWKVYGATFTQVEIDEHGMCPDKLEAAMRTGPKFIYLLSNFQNPSGATTSLERRKQIIEIADRYGVPIIEDDPYGQLRFEGEHLPPVIELDYQMRANAGGHYDGNVIYLSTFSKTLAPGMRMAWVIADRAVIRKLVQVKQGSDLHTATILQMATHEISKDNFIDEHIKVIRKVYRERRDLMIDTMEECFPPGVTWTKPQGGLFLWVKLPKGVDAYEMLDKAVAKKVAYVPGSPFYANGGGENTMRLNFSNANEEQIVEGIRRLGDLLREELLDLSPTD